MPDGDSEWPSQNNCCDTGQLWNYDNGRIVIFDTKLVDHLKNKEVNKKVLFSR